MSVCRTGPGSAGTECKSLHIINTTHMFGSNGHLIYRQVSGYKQAKVCTKMLTKIWWKKKKYSWTKSDENVRMRVKSETDTKREHVCRGGGCVSDEGSLMFLLIGRPSKCQPALTSAWGMGLTTRMRPSWIHAVSVYVSRKDCMNRIATFTTSLLGDGVMNQTTCKCLGIELVFLKVNHLCSAATRCPCIWCPPLW